MSKRLETLKENYVTGKLVQFFPNDIYKKLGYIRNVDEFGFFYEVTECSDPREIGSYFRSHSKGLVFKTVE